MMKPASLVCMTLVAATFARTTTAETLSIELNGLHPGIDERTGCLARVRDRQAANATACDQAAWTGTTEPLESAFFTIEVRD